MPDSVSITGPDSKEYEFPAGTTKDQAIAYFKKKGVGVNPQAALGQPVGSTDRFLQSSGLPTSSDLEGAASDLLTGVSQGAANTVGNSVTGIAGLLNKIPVVGKFLAPQEGIDALQKRVDERSTPENTAQKVGKYGEQIGEMLIPSGLEEKAVSAIPAGMRTIKGIVPLVKIAEQAGEMGVRNASQGGSFKEGAEGGAIGGTLGEAGKAIAPKLAETALAIPARMRGRGRTVGQAILDETSGITVKGLAAETKQKLATLTGALETAARNSTTPASTNPALQVIADAVHKASEQNDGASIEKLTKVWDQLTREYGTNNPIPTTMSAEKILNLKRGIGSLVNSWNPVDRKAVDVVIKKVYGALDAELDRTVPEAAALNQKISSLIPANQRAKMMLNYPSTIQKSFGRLAAHTGALTAAGVGGTIGYRENGIPGAIAGSAAGLVVPEVLTSPSGIMAAARAANSPVPKRLLIGSALQMRRKNASSTDDPDSKAINEVHENIQDFIDSLPK